MSERNYIIGDSVCSTIEFDVISVETGSPLSGVSPSVDLILFPEGLGFSQTVEVVTGETVDYVLSQTVDKEDIEVVLLWKGSNAYAKYYDFVKLVNRYNDLDRYRFRFSYELNGTRRYVEVAMTGLDLEGREDYYVSANLTMQPLTPVYEESLQSFTLTSASNSKMYAYTYPYYYGGGSLENNEMENGYIKPIPLKVVIAGPVESPAVSVYEVDDDGNQADEPYCQVQFVNTVSLGANETITIDAINSRIYKTSVNAVTGATQQTDLFGSVDKTYDAFLYAPTGRSIILGNFDGNENSAITVYYTEYSL